MESEDSGKVLLESEDKAKAQEGIREAEVEKEKSLMINM